MKDEAYGRAAARPNLDGRPAARPKGRRSIRLKGYDYSQAGAYFITLCTHDRACLFGEMVNGELRLNALAEIVRDEWFRSTEIRREIQLHPDEFVIMPNHIHGIVWIIGDDAGATGQSPVEATGQSPVGATGQSPVEATGQSPVGATGWSPPRVPHGPAPRSLASFIAGFKSIVTKRINQWRNTPGARVWQRNYYEHIIRNDHALHRICHYIQTNPQRWALDRQNLQRAGNDAFDDWLTQTSCPAEDGKR